MGRRKQDKWRDDSSDAKRRRSRPCHVGETSRANDGTSQEGLRDVIRDAVVEIKGAILVKEETKKEIDELKEKGRKYEEEIGILKEGHEDLKETIRVLQDQLRILKEGQEDDKSQIQEMKKRKFAEVDASPSQGSQPSESPEFNLQIENVMCSTMYKREPVTTIDGSGQIKVAMYYGNKPIRSDHSLASVKVKLVVLNGSFGELESWSREDFAENIIKGRDGKSLVKHDTFCLIDGRCDYKGAIIMDNSQQKEFKLGVRVIGRTELRVLEGVSNPFKVQEKKTKEKEKRVPEGVSNPSKVQERKTKVIVSKRKDKRPSPAVTTPNLEQPTSTHAIQDDRGKHTEYPTDDTGEDNGASYRPATMQQMVEGNGQANANGQRSYQQISTQTFLVPAYSTQHGKGPVNSDEQQIQHSLRKEVSLPQNFPDQGQHTGFPTGYTGEDNRASYPPATMQQMVDGNGQAQNGNGQNYRHCILDQFLGHSTSVHPMQHGQVHSSPPPNDLQAAVSPYLSAPGQDQYTNFPFGSSELAHQNYSAHASCHYTQDTSESAWLNDFQLDPIRGHKTFVGETYGSFTWRRVVLQCDNPHVELKKHWNFFDQIMPLYSTKSRFYTESFPSANLMDKAHKLLASISSGDSVSKMITSGRQTPQRKGVLIRPIGPYDSDDGPPVKKQRNAKYQLRFVNRVRSDYYTREQIKSEDGTFLKVALYDENNLVVTSGLLSSASVEVVVLHGDFSAEGQDFWRSEEFSTCVVHPQSAKEPPALGGDRVLALTDGEADLENVNFRISSFHARTGKFKMGVVIKNVREDSVEEGITSPFLVRVRLGEEPSRHRSTSLDSLLRVRVKLPNQVSGVLERDGKKKAGSSSALYDKSSQVISILGALMASDRPPEASSQVMSVLGAGSSTVSDLPPEPPSQVIRSQLPEAVSYFVASDQLLEPSHAPCDYSACSLCGKGLGPGKDIYMYRGEAFCSPECREEHIVIMEAHNGSRPPLPEPSRAPGDYFVGRPPPPTRPQSSQTVCAATQQEPYVASSAALRMDTQKMGQVGRK